MKCKPALAILLILSLAMMTSFCAEVQAQVQHSLDLQGLTWNHSTINVLVIPQDGASWWNPSYLNATLRSIAEWNNAIQVFALNYSNFAYLSRLRMVPTVSHALNYSFDIYVSWIQTFGSSASEIGLTSMYGLAGMIMNSTISLAAEDSHGRAFNEVDSQNVCLHELGHSLGLRHSDYSADIMYPTITLNHPVAELSTLDLYGVSMVFQWMSNSANIPYSPQRSSVTLPSSIQFRYLPVSYGILPSPTYIPTLPLDLSQILFLCGQTALTFGQTLLVHAMQFFLHPEVLISLSTAISAVFFTEFMARRAISNGTRKKLLD